MIPVTKLHALLDAGHTAAYDLTGDIEVLLPRDGVILSGEEVAQIRAVVIEFFADARARGRHDDGIFGRREAALSLLDSAGEET